MAAATLGYRLAWVGTQQSNKAARRLYAAPGGVDDSEDSVILEFDLGNESRRRTCRRIIPGSSPALHQSRPAIEASWYNHGHLRRRVR